MIGNKLKHEFTGNEAWVLSYREECFDQIGLKPSLRTPLFNGSLECELRKYQMFSGKFNEMRAEGGDIKTAQERRMMADRKRFKQHRDFKDKLEDDPRDRFRRKEDREDFRREDRREFKTSNREDDHRNFKRGVDRKDFKRDGDRRDFKRGDSKRSDSKSFNRNKGNNKYGKKHFNDED